MPTNIIATAVRHLGGYPMPYTDTTPSTFNELAGKSLLAALIICGAGIVILYLTDVNRTQRNLPDSTPMLIAALACFLVGAGSVIGLFVMAATASSVDSHADAVSRAAYDQSVIEWLKSDYGITVDDAALSRLTSGATLVVDYAGQETMIEFAERTDTGLAVRIPDGRLIQPAGKR